MIAEEWRPCIGGRYAVSNLGRVRRESPASGARPGRLLRQRTTKLCGYPVVGVKVAGKVRSFLVHRLVAEAFLGVCPDGLEVNHKNGNKSDPRVGNLEYVTHAENIAHAWRSGLGNPRRGEQSGHAKLTESDVRQIRALRASGGKLRDLASRFHISKSVICQIARRQIWRCVA